MDGRLWRLYVLIDGIYQPFAGATQESLSLSPRTVDRTSKERDGFRHTLRTDGGQADLSLSGVAKRSESLNRLRRSWNEKTTLPIFAEAEDAVLMGQFFADGYSETGPNSAAVQFSTSLKSNGLFFYLIGDEALVLRADRAFHRATQLEVYPTGSAFYG